MLILCRRRDSVEGYIRSRYTSGVVTTHWSLTALCICLECVVLGAISVFVWIVSICHVLFVSYANRRCVISLARNGVSAKCCVLI
jgi:hypothetical protein